MSQEVYSKEIINAWEKAKEVRQRAHAPYSKYKVGAALKIKESAELILGCNVENASYGATVCAERTAFQVAVAKFGKISPEYIMLVTQSDPAVPPCALCLQVFSEFCGPEFRIYIANEKEIQRVAKFGELLVSPFGPKDLLK